MIANRRGTKKVRAKVDRVFYKIDKDGNFSESKESMRSLYDATHKEERKPRTNYKERKQWKK